ncbi:MAG: hypothetical protein HZA25_03595 [Candidatus Niyogibacteria bacterium]|nr:hypothetical protein [Candidatus Niyogibacteria bacterium]
MPENDRPFTLAEWIATRSSSEEFSKTLAPEGTEINISLASRMAGVSRDVMRAIVERNSVIYENGYGGRKNAVESIRDIILILWSVVGEETPGWLRMAHPEFGGKTALRAMEDGRAEVVAGLLRNAIGGIPT